MPRDRRPTSRRSLLALVPVAAGVLLVTACGSSGAPDVGAAPSTTTTAAATTTTKPGGGTTTTTANGTGGGKATTTTTVASGGTVKFGQTVNYEGFVLTLHDGTTNTDDGTLTIPIDVENPGSDNATFYGDNISLDDGSTQLTTSISPKEFVSVLAGSKGKTAIIIHLPDTPVDPTKTFLAFGQGSQQQARIPYPGNSATPVLLTPIPQTFTTAVTVGDMTITSTSAEVRYDSVDDHQQLDKGKVAIVIKAKAKNNSTDNTYYWGNDEATLSLADGSKQQADRFGAGDFANPTKTVDIAMVFVVPAPFAGTYGIDFAAPWTKDGSTATAHADLTIADK